MADIKTLKDNETRVLPRTTSAAVMNDNGEPIENDINSISAPAESAANTLNVVTGTSADNVAQSIAELQNIKSDLKAALAEKGQTVGDMFSTYPAAVRAISDVVNLPLPSSSYGFPDSAKPGELVVSKFQQGTQLSLVDGNGVKFYCMYSTSIPNTQFNSENGAITPRAPGGYLWFYMPGAGISKIGT